MLERLKQEVFEANLQLPRYGLIKLTWGNVSGLDDDRKYFVIKPSGLAYDKMKPDDMVVVDLDGNKVEGELNPSTDTPTHAVLYRNFNTIGGIVHTHSPWATIWAQAGREIPAYGTTHADFFYGSIPCCKAMTSEQVEGNYEKASGEVIVDYFEAQGIKPEEMHCALLKSHGPYVWHKNAGLAVETALVLEEVAMMAFYTEILTQGKGSPPMPQYLLDKHFLRKHGPKAYYGQNKE